MTPQVRFLEFITTEVKRYPSLRLVLGVNVQRLVQESGKASSPACAVKLETALQR
jgi:hypothetical protein